MNNFRAGFVAIIGRPNTGKINSGKRISWNEDCDYFSSPKHHKKSDPWNY